MQFSVVIPHYNSPELLNRCLASIPERNDVEIIIVDDHSNPDIVDFKSFPGLGRKNTKCIFSDGKSGKGPGYARNVGVDNSNGKWVVFADSDDYFLSGFDSLLDSYKNEQADVVFFKTKKQNIEGIVSDYKMYNDLIDESIKNKDCCSIAYEFPCPWGKFIKRDFLLRNNIRFQQITGGDDILFSTLIAKHIEHYCLADAFLYCVVDCPGSLTRNNKWQGFYSYTKSCCQVYPILTNANRNKLAYDWIAAWWGRLWFVNKFKAIELFPKVANVMGFTKSLHCFKKAMKIGRWDWEKRER